MFSPWWVIRSPYELRRNWIETDFAIFKYPVIDIQIKPVVVYKVFLITAGNAQGKHIFWEGYQPFAIMDLKLINIFGIKITTSFLCCIWTNTAKPRD